ncbi:hypothetical protein, partial [Brevibacillus agri]|uniref:hypothetical protein n=1 Tax=Brevibacillus agri TaxID=51101 RepID=UPI003D216A74
SFSLGQCECDHSKTQHTGGAFFFQSSNFFITGMAPRGKVRIFRIAGRLCPCKQKREDSSRKKNLP